MSPTSACLRSKASLVIGYEQWREGTSYDIAALSGVTREERFLLANDICARSQLDRRGIEALVALAIPSAHAWLHDKLANPKV